MALLKGKVVIVTGAGAGIGREHALACARAGAKLVINDLGGTRDGSGQGTAAADQVVAEIKKLGGEAVANYDSVSDFEAARRIVQAGVTAFGRVDVLINNAGILRDKSLAKMDEPMWDAVIAVHLKGTFNCAKHFQAQVREQGAGDYVLINTTSIAGLEGNFGQTNYSAAKAGIYGMTMTWSKELRKDGVRVYAIAPVALTRMTEDLGVIPAELTPAHIAPVAVFLASPLAKDLNGVIVGVHGAELFEWKMGRSKGKTKAGNAPWTPHELAEQWAQIAAREAAPAAPSGGGRLAEVMAALAGARDNPAALDAALAALGGAGGAGGGAKKELTKSDVLRLVFETLPEGYDVAKGGDWKAQLFFNIGDTGGYSLIIEGGKARFHAGKPPAPTCTVTMDLDTGFGVFTNQIDAQQAYMGGKMKADNLNDLMKFGTVLSVKKLQPIIEARIAAAQGGAAPGGPAQAAPKARTPQDELHAVFGLIPQAFRADKAGNWAAQIFFDIAGTKGYSLVVKDGKGQYVEGRPPAPTCTVKTDLETGHGMFTGKVDANKAFMAGKIKADNLNDMMKFGQVVDVKRLTALAQEQFGAAPAGAGAAAPAAKKPAGEGMNRALIGKKYFGAHAWARPEWIVAYAQATNETNPRYLDEQRKGGLIAPPLFGVRQGVPLSAQAVMDPELNCHVAMLVHGEQEIVLHRPIRTWDLLNPRAQIESIEAKGSGELINVRQTFWVDGKLATEMVSGMFIRGAKKDGAKEAKKPEPDRGTPTATVTEQLDKNQTYRYAEASLDKNPIHVDDAVAKSVGFKGVINHGLCTMAFAVRAVVDKVLKGDCERLRRLKVRFSKPVYPGDTLTTTVWKIETNEGLTTFAFETKNQDGDVVLANGLAEAVEHTA